MHMREPPPALLCCEVPPDHIALHALLASSPPHLTVGQPLPPPYCTLLHYLHTVLFVTYSIKNRSWSD